MKQGNSCFWIMISILAVVQSGCGTAKSSDRAKAERVFMDQAGYVCFLVRDENGQAVGGNCLKE